MTKPTPFYEDAWVTLYCGDCREILPKLGGQADHILTDPPFASETHEGARSMRDRGASEIIPYAAISALDIDALLAGPARPKRWIVATMDYRHTAALEASPPAGLRFVRFGVWDKLDTGAPQISGDRPAMGWEAIAILHADTRGRMRWNAGGKRAVYRHPIARGDIPEEKPLGLLSEWVRDFTDEGELILDPWCGHGTTLRAAKDLGRRSIGIEIDPARCAHAAARMRQESLFAAVKPMEQAQLLDAPRVKRRGAAR